MRPSPAWCAVVLALAGACAESSLAPAANADARSLFDQVWHDVDRTYPMFALKAINWDSVGSAHRAELSETSPDSAVARDIGDMLRALRDRHVSLTWRGGASIVYNAPPVAAAPCADQLLLERKYLSGGTSMSTSHLRVGRTASGVGYIGIPSFAGLGWAGEMDDALTRLRGVTSLVVDVRCNDGGDYNTALAVAGRFLSGSHTFGYVRYRNGPAHDDLGAPVAEVVSQQGRPFLGRVIVLTNREVFSSAENFVLALKGQPNVTLVGETTGGASGRPQTRTLPNGWTYTVSTWIETTPTGQAVEDHGIAPDVAASAPSTDFIKGVDTLLERALSLALAP